MTFQSAPLGFTQWGPMPDGRWPVRRCIAAFLDLAPVGKSPASAEIQSRIPDPGYKGNGKPAAPVGKETLSQAMNYFALAENISRESQPEPGEMAVGHRPKRRSAPAM